MAEEKKIMLHGDLNLWIIQGRSLPNMNLFTENFNRCLSICSAATTTLYRGTGSQPHHRRRITSDYYVTVSLAGSTVARTAVIRNSLNPDWNEHFDVLLAHEASEVKFTVKDNDVFGADLIGEVTVPAQWIASGKPIRDWFPVIASDGRTPHPDTALLIAMDFLPAEKNPHYKRGIARDPEKLGVRNTYFPVRNRGMVKLYQDAHVNEGDLPRIVLRNGKVFEHGKCWEDICHAILDAHHLIYIVGWSIYHKVRLVREPTRPLSRTGELMLERIKKKLSLEELTLEELTLGQLLKFKSFEGVKVCLLVWDDKTSNDMYILKKGGVMQTHDEETRNFFKHSSVYCVLSPRYGSDTLSIFKQKVVGTIYSHHQKCVLVDTKASEDTRKITAFLGGLDLCDGRYDTPQHRLFKGLDSVFKDDFHNPTFPEKANNPRQPWHDLHCKIDGPAAYDVLKNFEQRWEKAIKWSEFGGLFRKVPYWNYDSLFNLENKSWILSPSSIANDDQSLWVSSEGDNENWHVQVFRSIDSGSVKGFPKVVKNAREENLVCGKNLVIDQSIHTAYVKAIRSAQHFIYIENQYFLGSSYGWSSHNKAGADNLIPMELALKIASKIRASERFAVYIIIPMWPEGNPTDSSVQEILFWQSQTMKMMYEIIANELERNGSDLHPQDYLNFYCLGNLESLANQASVEGDVAKFRRFMVYVHSKGMIVDDEYIILGSANINQRSLDGARDTEIAMGAYQPHYTCAENRYLDSQDANKKMYPHGQIYGYRMSLWAEHLGLVHDLFKEPHKLECVRLVNKIAEDNLDFFTADYAIPLKGHLLKYPIMVDHKGDVCPYRNQENFPEVGGKILGAATNIPDALTT